jgi:predicted phage-related endonuclease
VELDQEIRRTGITSTEVGPCLGVDPQRDLHSVKAVKMGGVIVPPNWSMQIGHFLEPVILEIYSWKTGRELKPERFNRTYRHTKYPHVLATPDALWVDGKGGVDAKRPNFFGGRFAGEDAEDLPDSAHFQMITCMEVLDVDEWHVAVLSSNDQFHIVEVKRDREFGEALMKRIEYIWARYFEGDEWPEIGASRISAQWLSQHYPKNIRSIRLATDDEIELLTRYGEIRLRQKELKKEREALENKLKNAVKDCDGIEWEHGRFTWRLSKDSTRVDWESMAIALRTHFMRDEADRKKVTLEHTRNVAGSRRIYFKTDKYFETAEADDAE